MTFPFPYLVTEQNPLGTIHPVEPQQVLRTIEGADHTFRIVATNNPPYVWVIEGNGYGGWYQDLDHAKQWIDNRQAAIKRNQKRIAGEKTVVRRVVKDLLAAGYAITVHDGEEDTVKKSTKFSEIVAATMTTDEDYLIVSKPGAKNSFVRFVYGNDAWEVICDHGVSLEDVLAGAREVCDRLERRGR